MARLLTDTGNDVKFVYNAHFDTRKIINRYTVEFSKFNGVGDAHIYEFKLNQSMIHTGKVTGIEAGLNLYTKWEQSKGLKRWILGKILNYCKHITF